jgi:hypothetical protein
MNRAAFLSTHEDRKLLNFVNVRHSVAEAAFDVCVAVSIEFLL